MPLKTASKVSFDVPLPPFSATLHVPLTALPNVGTQPTRVSESANQFSGLSRSSSLNKVIMFADKSRTSAAWSTTGIIVSAVLAMICSTEASSLKSPRITPQIQLAAPDIRVQAFSQKPTSPFFVSSMIS